MCTMSQLLPFLAQHKYHIHVLTLVSNISTGPHSFVLILSNAPEARYLSWEEKWKKGRRVNSTMCVGVGQRVLRLEEFVCPGNGFKERCKEG